MKKIITPFAVILLFSCSKDNIDTVTPDKSIVLNTSLLSVSNGHDISNIQVGDTLTYKYDITSNLVDGDNYIVPETVSTIKHQRQNIDFTLFYNKLKCDTVKCLSKTGSFKILVNRAGNFQSAYTSLNFAKGPNKPITTSNATDISFNAVRIIAYRYSWEWDRRGSSLFGYRYYYRHFHKLYIDCGNQQNDIYLQNLGYNLKYYSFNVNRSGFIQNSNIDFHEVQETDSGNSPSVQADQINKLTFYKSVNGIQTTIEYNNVSVPHVGEHNDWGYNGNNNL